VENKEEASKGAKQLAQSWKAPADSMHELAKDHCFPWHRKAEVKSREILLRRSARTSSSFLGFWGPIVAYWHWRGIIPEFGSRSITEKKHCFLPSSLVKDAY